jgi:hypothetical protein
MVEYRQEKTPKCPPELTGNPTSSHLVANQEQLGEANDEIGPPSIYVLILK